MNVKKIVNKFGGTRPAAEKIGRPVPTVNSWVVRNKIPSEHWGDIIEAGRKIGIDVSLSDFIGKMALGPLHPS